jgi:hypothetical protein
VAPRIVSRDQSLLNTPVRVVVCECIHAYVDGSRTVSKYQSLSNTPAHVCMHVCACARAGTRFSVGDYEETRE